MPPARPECLAVSVARRVWCPASAETRGSCGLGQHSPTLQRHPPAWALAAACGRLGAREPDASSTPEIGRLRPLTSAAAYVRRYPIRVRHAPRCRSRLRPSVLRGLRRPDVCSRKEWAICRSRRSRAAQTRPLEAAPCRRAYQAACESQSNFRPQCPRRHNAGSSNRSRTMWGAARAGRARSGRNIRRAPRGYCKQCWRGAARNQRWRFGLAGESIVSAFYKTPAPAQRIV